MASDRSGGSRARSFRAAWVVLVLSCQAVLGIEDLSTAPREPGEEPTGSAGGGGTRPVGAAGSTGTTEQPAGLDIPGAGGAPSDDDEARADAGTALDAATADAAPAVPSPVVVAGRVIDFYRHPVPLSFD